MYRYTEKKNRQANKRQAERRLRVRQAGTKKRNAGKNSGVSRRSSIKAKQAASKKLNVKNAKKMAIRQKKTAKWLERGASLATFLLVGFFLLAVLIGIYALLMNSFLPQYFSLEQEKNILLVDSSINERAQNLYLVQLDPIADRVTVWSLPGDLEVELIGQYKKYPLASVGPLVYRYSEDLQEVKAAYNFALGLVLDEFYFLPGGDDLTTRLQIQELMGDLLADHWQRTSQLDHELMVNYFAVRSARSFTLTQVTSLDQIRQNNAAVGREDLRNCQLRIYNAAAANGLARRVSDLLTSYGVSVIKLETAQENVAKSTIYYDESISDCVNLVQLLQENLPKGVEAVSDGGEVARAGRAGAVLYLGEELAN